MNEKDHETLSAYLDGQIEPVDLARLEARLHTDPKLRSTLEDLRSTRDLLRKLPTRRAPRNFTLSRSMVALRPPLPRAYSGFRFAAVMATILFLCMFTANILAPRMLSVASAPAPEYGFGGGGGGPETFAQEAPAATEAPAEEPLPGAVPLPTATLSVQDNLRTLATPETKTSERESIETRKINLSTPSNWVIAFGVVAFLCGVIAFGFYQAARARWRR